MVSVDLKALVDQARGLLGAREAAEAVVLLEGALEDAQGDELERATLLGHLAAAHAHTGAYGEAETAAEEAHELAAARGARPLLAVALRSRAVLRLLQRDWVQAIDDWRLLGNVAEADSVRYDALAGEALAWVGEDELSEAEARLRALPRRPMGPSMEGRVLLAKAALAAARGELHAATQGWVAGAEALAGSPDWILAVPGLLGVAASLESSGDAALPLAAAERATAVARESGNERLLGHALLALSRYYEAAGQLPAADDFAAEALRSFERVGALRDAARAHERALELAVAIEAPGLLVQRGVALARVKRDLGDVRAYEQGIGEALVLATRFESQERPALAQEVADILAGGGPAGAPTVDVIALAAHVAMGGLVERAHEILAERAQAAAQARRDEAAAQLFAAAAELSHELGDVGAAIAELQRAISLGERLGLADAAQWAERLSELG